MSIYCPDCGRAIEDIPSPGTSILCPCCGRMFAPEIAGSGTLATAGNFAPAIPPVPPAGRPEASPGRTTAPYTPPPLAEAPTRLTVPPPVPQQGAALAEAVPHVPGYEVLGVLGRGGMGIVYKARQVGLNRLVALKMILAGSHAGPEHLARFKVEAEAVARLQHPHIVQIHDIGEAGGRPFFSLEFVTGQSLAAHLAGTPQPPRDAARLVETLARAVEAAHVHGIIHRDLKPANVLLAEDGSPKVADFGLAKQMNADSGQTQTGQILGTPSYMAPEQATGRLDQIGPATDVYALGAILYECLTGRPPFKGTSVMDTLELVRAQEPVSPRQLQPKTPRDLETVCLKCLHKAPARRYPSAAALADDLARFLAGEPVQARPVGRLERGLRWCRRNPSRTGAAVLALLAATAAVALVLGIRAQQARRDLGLREARQKIDLTEEMVAHHDYLGAHLPLRQAQTLLEQYPEAGELGDRLQRLRNQVEPQVRLAAFRKAAREAEFHLLGTLWMGVSGTGRPVGQPLTSRRGADFNQGLRQARLALEVLGLREASAPATAFLEQGLDAGAREAARFGAAEVLLLLALALERQARGQSGDGRTAMLNEGVARLRMAEALDGRSTALYEVRARLLRGLGHSDEAVTDERKGAGPPITFLDHHLRAGALHRREQWAEAATGFESALSRRRDEYWTLFRLAKTRERLGRFSDSGNLYSGCIALRPDDPTAYNNRGTVLLAQRAYAKAAEDFEAALTRDPDYVVAYGNLMLAHAERKQIGEAEKVYRRLLARQPTDRRQHASALVSLGLAYERAGRLKQALANYDAAAALDANLSLIHRNRAVVLLALHRLPEARRAIQRAVELEPEAGGHRFVLGNVHAEAGQPRQARQAYTEAVERAPGMWNAWYNRAVLYRADHDHEKALEDLDRALALAPNNPMVLRERAMTLAALKRFEAALEDARRLDTAHGDKGEVRRLRGKILGDMGRLDRSEAELSRAIKEAPEEPDGYRSRAVNRMRAHRWQGAVDDFKEYLRRQPDAADVAGVWNDLSVAYLNLGLEGRATGALKEAHAALDRAVALRRTPSVLTNRGNFFLRFGAFGPAVADFGEALRRDATYDRAWALRGKARLRQGQYAEAAADFTRALELIPGHYETLLYLALARHLDGDDRSARMALTKVVRDRPDHVRGKFARGILHLFDGEWGQAVTRLSQAEDDEVLRPWVLLLRARAWLKLGARCLPAATADADARVKELPDDGLAHLLAARVYGRALKEAGPGAPGRLRDRALELLEGAVKRQPSLTRGLTDDPELEPLRGQPRFRRLTP